MRVYLFLLCSAFLYCIGPLCEEKRWPGVTKPIAVQMSREKDSLSISLTDQSSTPTLSISMEGTLNQDSVTLQDSDSDMVSVYTAKSFDEPGMVHQCQLDPPPGLLPTFRRPVSVPSAPPPAFLPAVCPASVPLAPPGILPTLHPAFFPPHFHHPTKSIPCQHMHHPVLKQYKEPDLGRIRHTLASFLNFRLSNWQAFM